MEKSESIALLAAALTLAQGEIEGASKDRENPHFKSKYADLASCWEACRQPLSKNGLSVVQLPKCDGASVTVLTLLLHKSGEYLGESLTVTAVDSKPQSVGSALTYARRYGLSAVVGIAPEDDDAEAAQGRQMAPVNTQARQFIETPAEAMAAVATGYNRKQGQAATPKPAGVAVKDSDIPFREVV